MEKNLDSDALVDKKILAERGEGPAVISTAEVARRIVEIKRRAHASGLCHNTSDEIRRIGSQISQWEMTAYGVASEVIERARAEALTRSSQLIADAESHAAALTSDARKSAQLIVQDAHRRARVLRHGVREAPMEPAAENGVARFRRGERRTDTVRWPVARSASEGRTSIEVGGENKGYWRPRLLGWLGKKTWKLTVRNCGSILEKSCQALTTTKFRHNFSCSRSSILLVIEFLNTMVRAAL